MQQENVVPTFEDLLNNKNLRDNKAQVDLAFIYNPKVILFYDQFTLTKEMIESAFKRGYKPTKEDLIYNPSLTNTHYFMEYALKVDPSLIVYTGATCHLDNERLEETIKLYPLSKKDFIEHPALRDNRYITGLPQYKIYASYLTEDEKINYIIDYWQKDFSTNVFNLPLFDKDLDGKTDISKLNKLFNLLLIPIDDTKIENQSKYFQILNKVIDSVCELRYKNIKSKLKYPDIITLNDAINNLFDTILKTRNLKLLFEFAKELETFTCNIVSYDTILNELYKFYDLYLKTSIVDISVTSDFCNYILNQHRNGYLRTTKEYINEKLTNIFTLSKRKKESLINGSKIKEFNSLLNGEESNQYFINKEKFNKILNDTIDSIITNKDINKLGIIISKESLLVLGEYYLTHGSLNENITKSVLNIDNPNVIKYITHKILQISYKYTSDIKINDNNFNIDISKFPKLNYNDYLILDKNRYLRNLASILLNVDDNLTDKILENSSLLNELIYLIPLLNLVKDFDTLSFINIMATYERIRYKIYQTNTYEPDVDFKELMLKKISDLITLGNAYINLDNLNIEALSPRVAQILDESKSNEYLDVYLDMLERKTGYIPPVSIAADGFYLESGNYSDVDRLLIGKIPNKVSCIDLFDLAGQSTYLGVLLENYGDIILIRDQQHNMLSRIIVIRNGNIINMVTGFSEVYNLDLYVDIANVMMKQAIINNDNLDYIFVSAGSVSRADRRMVFRDSRFSREFPHADFADAAVLVASKNHMLGKKDEEIGLKLNIEPKALYQKARKPVTYTPTEEHLTRLKALKIILEKDEFVKEELKKEFEPFYLKEYEWVVAGEDWYLALKKDNTLEEVVLPLNDSRAYIEIEDIKSSLSLPRKI